MLTQEQQDALSGTGAYRPSLPPPSGSTFRPLPEDMGRPNVFRPSGFMGMMGDFLLIALLGMLG